MRMRTILFLWIAIPWATVSECSEERTPPQKRFAEIAHTITGAPHEARIDIPTSRCKTIFRDKLPIIACTAELIAQGNAVVVRATRDCGGDTCSIDAFVITKDGRELPSTALFDGAANIELDSARRHIYADRLRPCAPDEAKCMQSTKVELIRIDISSHAVEPWADCFSPAALPGSEWVYCRGQDGSVSRFKENTKELALVWANPNKAGAYFVPYAYIYPQPVLFKNGFLVVQITDADGSDRTEHIHIGEMR